jgi:aspartate aminotransferase-like enzyme
MEVKSYQDLNISPRILLGPGPSMVSPRVLNALSHASSWDLDQAWYPRGY